MSAQGTILRRRGMHLPIWPVAALLVMAAVATAIGLRVMDGLRQAEPVTEIHDVVGNWNATVGDPGPLRQGRSGLGPLFDASVIEGSAAAPRELPSGPFHAPGRAHEVFLDSPVEATMPVQRLYPEGFGEATEDGTAPIFDGRRRKW